MIRNLDGVYFRIQDDDGKWVNRCFTDLTKEQRNQVLENRNLQWYKSMINILADVICDIGEQFDLCAGEE